MIGYVARLKACDLCKMIFGIAGFPWLERALGNGNEI